MQFFNKEKTVSILRNFVAFFKFKELFNEDYY
jgi:hypothetical protein